MQSIVTGTKGVQTGMKRQDLTPMKTIPDLIREGNTKFIKGRNEK
jgi:hypothetical protein